VYKANELKLNEVNCSAASFVLYSLCNARKVRMWHLGAKFSIFGSEFYDKMNFFLTG